MRASAAVCAAGLLLASAGLVREASGQTRPLELAVAPASAEWRPLVRLNGLLLEDRGLREALASGLPLRIQFRVELWEKAFFDRLIGSDEISLALLQDPLESYFRLSDGRSNQSFAGLADAERALGRALSGSLRRVTSGRRYYYLAVLEIETLSSSDLEELQRWLRGEARPAVQGRAPVGRALSRGVQRAFVRMIGLPTRRYEARTPTFTATD